MWTTIRARLRAIDATLLLGLRRLDGVDFTQVDWNTTTIDVLTVETASAELTKFLEARGFARVFCVALDSVFVAARLKKVAAGLKARATDWYGRIGRYTGAAVHLGRPRGVLGGHAPGTVLRRVHADAVR